MLELDSLDPSPLPSLLSDEDDDDEDDSDALSEVRIFLALAGFLLEPSLLLVSSLSPLLLLLLLLLSLLASLLLFSLQPLVALLALLALLAASPSLALLPASLESSLSVAFVFALAVLLARSLPSFAVRLREAEAPVPSFTTAVFAAVVRRLARGLRMDVAEESRTRHEAGRSAVMKARSASCSALALLSTSCTGAYLKAGSLLHTIGR